MCDVFELCSSCCVGIFMKFEFCHLFLVICPLYLLSISICHLLFVKGMCGGFALAVIAFLNIHLLFVICHLSFAICHLPFVI